MENTLFEKHHSQWKIDVNSDSYILNWYENEYVFPLSHIKGSVDDWMKKFLPVSRLEIKKHGQPSLVLEDEPYWKCAVVRVLDDGSSIIKFYEPELCEIQDIYSSCTQNIKPATVGDHINLHTLSATKKSGVLPLSNLFPQTNVMFSFLQRRPLYVLLCYDNLDTVYVGSKHIINRLQEGIVENNTVLSLDKIHHLEKK